MFAEFCENPQAADESRGVPVELVKLNFMVPFPKRSLTVTNRAKHLNVPLPKVKKGAVAPLAMEMLFLQLKMRGGMVPVVE